MQQWKNMVIFDTNMILRYLLKDNEEMMKKAKEYLIAGNVIVTIEVVAEVVYVLKGVYSMERSLIADKLLEFLDLIDCSDDVILEMALRVYATHNIDFVDCVLYAYSKMYNAEIATFDKKILRLLSDV